MKGSMKKLAVFVIITVIGSFIMATMALAGDEVGKVYGEYAFSGTGGCLISRTGFNPNLSPLPPFWTNSFNLSGVFIFNRDGTGDGQATQVGVTATAPSPGASLMEYSFPFTYSIADDGTITVVGGEITGNILAGSVVVGTFTVDKWSLSGMVSPDHKTMTLATGAPEIETVELLYFPSFALTVYEICHRSDTLIRIHK